ncbi:MAG TPA: hypothetical protein VFP84_11920 [Kofleriaceae bacterium]|nr:hypothetical protein [Kofleriaceae bacterium]
MTSAMPSAMTHRHYRVARHAAQPVLRPASAFNFPLVTPRDYAAITDLLPVGADAPVLLDHAQYFEWLARVVGELRAQLPGARIFLELRMPSVGSLPEGLLRADVLMGAELAAEAAFWAAHGAAPVVWIGDRIRRELDHAADNTLAIAVAPPAAVATVEAVVARPWPAHAITIVSTAPSPSPTRPTP